MSTDTPEPGKDPIPERPRDAGVPEREPEAVSAIEGARVLANEAREQLAESGFDDEQIRIWADAYIERMGAGTVEQFVDWIRTQEGSNP